MENTPLERWTPPESPYRKIVPLTHSARLISENSAFALNELSPYVKIFAQDSFKSAPLTQEIRALRNSRFYRQFVITNRTDKALTFTLDPDTAVLKNGEATLPVSFRSVGFIETREPSNFKLQYPIGKYPAPLLPLKNRTVTVLPESNQSLFIEVFVPENQPAGKYTGNICMGDIKLPVVCDVLAAALPQRSTLRSTVGCWSLSP